MSQLKLTEEEEQVLKQCRSESFWYRCVPLSVGFGTFAFHAVKSGFVSGSKMFGPYPKIIIAGVVGYVLGKASYVMPCKQKFLLQVPNSNISRSLKKAKGQYVPDLEESDQVSMSDDTNYFRNSVDDIGNNDYFTNEEKDAETTSKLPIVTYDELRAKHRLNELDINDMRMKTKMIKRDDTSVPYESDLVAETNSQSLKRNPTPQNKYGDDGFE